MSRSTLVLLLAAAVAAAGTSVRLGGALYPRFMFDAMGSSFELMGAEGNIEAQVSGETRDIVTALIQVRAAGAMSGWTSGLRAAATRAFAADNQGRAGGDSVRAPGRL
jgi:hypothetical protein